MALTCGLTGSVRVDKIASCVCPPALSDRAPGLRLADVAGRQPGVEGHGDHGVASRGGGAFEATYGAKFPKAVAKVTDDVEELPAFYDYPAEHWRHLRTTNPNESTFATVRHRTKVTKGPGSRAAGLAMAFKLIESAQTRWRAVNGAHLVALVRAAATSINGKLVERPAESPVPTAA
jgi:hypothetical protein